MEAGADPDPTAAKDKDVPMIVLEEDTQAPDAQAPDTQAPDAEAPAAADTQAPDVVTDPVDAEVDPSEPAAVNELVVDAPGAAEHSENAPLAYASASASAAPAEDDAVAISDAHTAVEVEGSSASAEDAAPQAAAVDVAPDAGADATPPVPLAAGTDGTDGPIAEVDLDESFPVYEAEESVADMPLNQESGALSASTAEPAPIAEAALTPEATAVVATVDGALAANVADPMTVSSTTPATPAVAAPVIDADVSMAYDDPFEDDIEMDF
jgi:hypothetical protein